MTPQKRGLLKAFFASLGVGAVTGVASKNILKETVDNVVPLTKENINSEVLRQALADKWATANAGRFDLTTNTGYLQFHNFFHNIGQTGLANNLADDYYLLAHFEQGDLSFKQFLSEQDLAQYVSAQDPNESVRTAVADLLKQKIESEYGFSDLDKETTTDREIAQYIMNLSENQKNADKIDKMFNELDTWQAWSGKKNPDNDFYSLIGDHSSSAIANATTQERATWCMDNLQDSPYYVDSDMMVLLRYSHINNIQLSRVEDRVFFTRQYYYAKSVATTDKYSDLNINDAVSVTGLTPEMQDQVDIVYDNEKSILENAVETKNGLEDGSVDFRYTNEALVVNMQPGEARDQLANDLVNGLSYRIYTTEKSVSADSLTGPEKIDMLGVSDQVSQMIENGATIIDGTTAQAISDEVAFKFGGIGGGASLVIMLTMYKLRQRKINKLCKANPEAAAELVKYYEEKQANQPQKLSRKERKALKKQEAQSVEKEENTLGKK